MSSERNFKPYENNTTSIWSSQNILKRCAAVYSKIDEYYQGGMYTDVKITCENRVFECHRLVLAAASNYFHQMFSGNFVESRLENVVLHDIDPITFEQVLFFVYKCEIATINDDNVFNLLRASDILQLSGIEDFCVHYLTQKNIPMDFALEIYLFALALRKVDLIPALSRFILHHLDRFSQESEFLKMSFDDFSALLTYFQPSSANPETKLLNAIHRWVCHSTEIPETRKSSFMELALKVQFKSISAAQVAEYFDRNSSVDSSDESRPYEVSETLDMNPNLEMNELSLYLYLLADEYVVRSNIREYRWTKQTSVLSLRENVGKNIDCHYSRHKISPAFDTMRIIESDDRLYYLRAHGGFYTFSSSTAFDLCTNLQSLTPPCTGFLVPRSIRSFSLCRLQENVYLSHSYSRRNTINVGIRSYNMELDRWSKIPVLSTYYPSNLVNDDSRLYIIDRNSSLGSLFFAAYDPRVGKVEVLNSKGLSHMNKCTEPACHHKGKIYLLDDEAVICDHAKLVRKSEMVIYNPTADRWDIQDANKLYEPMDFCRSKRVASFNNRLWIFMLDSYNSIYCHTYDSYLQEWSIKYDNNMLGNSLNNLDQYDLNFVSAVAFKSS